MMKVYQKPTCSKCRNLIKTLQERKVAFDAINYYTEPLTAVELKDILEKLGMGPKDLMRKNETIYKELEIGTKDYTESELIDFLVANPDLIQRPIVLTDDKASIVRSEEAVDQLLENI